MAFFGDHNIHACWRSPRLIIGVALIANLLFFALLFGFHPNNDTESFVWTIQFFRGEDAAFHPNRYLNPLYPVLGATLLAPLSPALVIIVLNILFYLGMVFLTYGLVRRVFCDRWVGVVAALLLIPSYALLRYGLTQVQDMGGYFWFVLTLYAGWRSREGQRTLWLHLAGVAVAFGLLTKESGAMGALFIAALLVEVWRKEGLSQALRSLGHVVIWPLLTLMINGVRGAEIGYTSLQWFVDNWHVYAPTNYTLFKWAGVNATTYHLIWIAFLVGIFLMWKNRRALSADVRWYLLAVLLPSLSYLAWPLFISRTVFIFAWLILPVAAYGIVSLLRSKKGVLRVSGGLLLIGSLVAPYLLQWTLRYAHLFQILDLCNKNLFCSWRYFWEHRESFSIIK